MDSKTSKKITKEQVISILKKHGIDVSDWAEYVSEWDMKLVKDTIIENSKEFQQGIVNAELLGEKSNIQQSEVKEVAEIENYFKITPEELNENVLQAKRLKKELSEEDILELKKWILINKLGKSTKKFAKIGDIVYSLEQDITYGLKSNFKEHKIKSLKRDKDRNFLGGDKDISLENGYIAGGFDGRAILKKVYDIYLNKVDELNKEKELSEKYNIPQSEVKTGLAIENEHKDTVEKLYNHEITPEEGVVEIFETHEKENKNYYDDEIGLPAMEKELEEKSEIENLHLQDINNKFVEQLIKKYYELSRTNKNKHGDNISSTFTFLRGIENASSKDKGTKQFKEKENELVKEFAIKNGLFILDTNFKNKIGRGYEQNIFKTEDKKYVLKLNNCSFYSTWEDYLINVILNNYFFPQTRYELLGFTEFEDNFCAVVKQIFIAETSKYDFSIVNKTMIENGFKNTKNADYFNPLLGIILEDLHDENVLFVDDKPFFIDTVFYYKELKLSNEVLIEICKQVDINNQVLEFNVEDEDVEFYSSLGFKIKE